MVDSTVHLEQEILGKLCNLRSKPTYLLEFLALFELVNSAAPHGNPPTLTISKARMYFTSQYNCVVYMFIVDVVAAAHQEPHCTYSSNRII